MATEQPMIINPAKENLKRGPPPITGLAVFESLRPSIYKVVAETGYDIVRVIGNTGDHALFNSHYPIPRVAPVGPGILDD